ncbi:hypothetical protein PMIN06_008259 [Paraphaeosphaeria minitans]|uniref:Uncharacterized protein n=1 Tax=Paraphaeosphaeria minitans TaxID=565426 RepID=A0A9P6GPD6_9PLEO|nr:hypothetical protein PMIN01_02046 [Paraphaeosphaeria minitans]
MSFPIVDQPGINVYLQSMTTKLADMSKQDVIQSRTHVHIAFNTLRQAHGELCDQVQDAAEANDLSRVGLLRIRLNAMMKDSRQLLAKA